MCLEPFGATGLFILGRGGLLLLLLGVGREKRREERKKRKGGGKRVGNLEECPGSAQRPQVGSQELALPHFIITSRQGPRPSRKRREKTQKESQRTLPRVKVASQFLKRLGKLRSGSETKHTHAPEQSYHNFF